MEKINFWLLFSFLLPISLIGQNSHELIITEIFADPTPTRGLPEKEYIEVYNNSNETIELSNYRFFYNTSSTRFPQYSLPSNTYLLVCRNGNSSLFGQYGAVVELSQFSLLNTGTSLKLAHDTKGISHELNYNSKWYTLDKTEGYALEMIDLDFPCVGLGNWASSENEIGGTPAKENSIKASKPDILSPSISEYSVQNRELKVVFSEPVGKNITLLIDIEPQIAVDSISFNDDFTQVVIYIKNELDANLDYFVKLNGIADCSGNVSDQLELKIVNRPSPSFGDILISELLFDPYPGGEDFVELKNVSNKALSLTGLNFYNKDKEGELRSEFALKDALSDGLILEPDSIVCLTRNKTFLLDNYENSSSRHIIEVENFPAMPNETGELIVINDKGELIDEIYYSADWHHFSIDDSEGVSLERVDFSNPSQLPENWQSSSGTIGFASPGVVLTKPEISLKLVETYPEIITPDGDGMEDELSILFSGIKNAMSASIQVFDRFGVSQEKIASNLYVAPGSKLVWNGRPATGERLATGYYYLYVELVEKQKVETLKIPFVIAYRN